MSSSLQLCWWEVDELDEHLTSREDLWTRSDDNSLLWIRSENRANSLVQAFAMLLIPNSPEPDDPFRMFTVSTVPITWPQDHIDTYLQWLVGHWTSYRRRTVVTKFLEEELNIDPRTAPIAAIAIEGLSWDADETKEPAAPPLQEELWPKDIVLPATAFVSDPSLIGTYLLSGSAGWLQLRLIGGMIRVSLHIRAKESTEVLAISGLVRPLNGRVRDTAAALAGWPQANFTSDSPAQPSLGDTQ